MDPGSAAHHFVLRSIRGTLPIRSPSLTHFVRAIPHFVRISLARDRIAAAALPV
jgi:hypothetical protein